MAYAFINDLFLAEDVEQLLQLCMGIDFGAHQAAERHHSVREVATHRPVEHCMVEQ